MSEIVDKSFDNNNTAAQVQKERRLELEQNANALLKNCKVATLTSVNESGYPRSCLLSIAYAAGFSEIYFITSKRSGASGKVAHFESNPKASVCYSCGGDSVTLIGEVNFITDKEMQKKMLKEEDLRFFKNGVDDPKFRLIRFRTLEATFWIGGKFRTCKYKQKAKKYYRYQ